MQLPAAKPDGGKGEWQLLLKNTGVVAMHMAITHRNTVVMFDQTGSGRSGYRLRKRHDGTRCRDNHHCDWREGRKLLSNERWYASSLKLPDKDDRVIVVGGRGVLLMNLCRKDRLREVFYPSFLRNTYDRNEGGNNLYPIVHLSSDGHLFMFANRDSILFDYKRNRVVKKFPRIPGKGSRSYPSTASSVILPLHYKDASGKWK
ncbi:UNVERIFIED_CONTAM: hypothetical protein Sradi_7307100 [Sesamum radiatum]|uniref:Glyoxal oxidase N-terminal domain-containing protein n=1 Tax=Sesamum radiatum TaxID=300843 RepID=A0AAW2I8F2_SESRA